MDFNFQSFIPSFGIICLFFVHFVSMVVSIPTQLPLTLYSQIIMFFFHFPIHSRLAATYQDTEGERRAAEPIHPFWPKWRLIQRRSTFIQRDCLPPSPIALCTSSSSKKLHSPPICSPPQSSRLICLSALQLGHSPHWP